MTLRRTFLALTALFFVTSALAPAAFGADDKDDKDKPAGKHAKDHDKKKGEDKNKNKKKSPSPIKKLIEVRIDQHLVAAKLINLPLPGRTRTVRELVQKFDKWAEDEEIGAVLLNLDGLYLSLPDVEELRSGVQTLKDADKKVFAFLNAGDPMGYLLACLADEIAIAPSGAMVIPGIGRLFPFMRGMFQMQGIEYEVITAGLYKYPGFLNRREPNKYFTEEITEIMDGWFEDYVKIIAQGRGMSPEKVKQAIDVALFDAQDAKNRGLVDVITYYDDFSERLVRRTKFKKIKEWESDFSRITSFQDLMTAISKQMKEAQDKYKAVGPKIAVLHARGPIIDMNLGSSYASMLIMRDEFVKSVEEIRKNKTIRAVVLRVDSPGGSGYASDVIWRKLRELDEEKPLVVSMGTVAGSGGYYIACPGRLIFAEPTTLTGSIGVLAILGNQASMLNRIDVNLSEMKRGARSLLGSGHRDLLPEDRAFIQKFILDFYEIFLDRVASTRKMPKDEVRKIAGGRIYTGRQALAIGLIDRLGSLKDAVAAVRDMADIPPSAEIKLVHYPRPATFGEFAESLFGMSMMSQTLSRAQCPTPQVSFESQARYFAQRLQPLCWMAVPDLHTLTRPQQLHQPAFDLLNPAAYQPALLQQP